MAADGKGEQTETHVTIAFPERELSDDVARFRASAMRHLAVGAHQRAFSELARASRHVPMTERLAAHIVDVALRTGHEEAAVTVLGAAVETVEGDAKIGVRRALARLFRRMGEPLRAMTALRALLEDAPG